MRFQAWGRKKPAKRKKSGLKVTGWIRAQLDWHVSVWTILFLLGGVAYHEYVDYRGEQRNNIKYATKAEMMELSSTLTSEIQKGFAGLKARPARIAQTKPTWAPFGK